MSRTPAPDLVIRPLLRRDFPAVAALNRATFEEHAARETGFGDDGPVRRLGRLGSVTGRLVNALSRRPLVGLVAEIDGAFAGYLITMLAPPDTSIFFDIGVVPEARRHGIGRDMFLAAEAEARRRGYARFVATVWPKNRASIRLLEEFGYAPAPDQPGDGTIAYVKYV